MPPAAHWTIIGGTSPVVLVAPHGGRRDPARRPWGSGRLRVNDLHTPALTAELAARLGASALINAERDRNEVDLNRISEAHDGAPGFLERLADLLHTTLARHGRATLLTVHGWNVIQPAVDLGLGCAAGKNPLAVDAGAAVSPAFAAGALGRLVAACAARGLSATVGARYPARHRENLLQLFTSRYRHDPRALVRALAVLAPQVDAVQLELGIPLRWPGAWRTALLDACTDCLPALTMPSAGDAVTPAGGPAPATHGPPVRLQFTSSTLCGLVGLDGPTGGRLLLFPPAGGLVLFTGEWLGAGPPGSVGPLTVRSGVHPDACHVRLRGPLLRFADTLPFLDLEHGLAGAELVDAEVALDFTTAVPPGDRPAGCFGTVAGRVRVAGTPFTVDGSGFYEESAPAGPWPRLRAQLELGAHAGLALTLGLADGQVTGSLRRAGCRVAVVAARAGLGPDDAPLARVDLDVDLADGQHVAVRARALHRLPVIRGRGPRPVRLEFAACRLENGPPWPVGWCEVGGV